jgi:hypothetical protein
MAINEVIEDMWDKSPHVLLAELAGLHHDDRVAITHLLYGSKKEIRQAIATIERFTKRQRDDLVHVTITWDSVHWLKRLWREQVHVIVAGPAWALQRYVHNLERVYGDW